MRRCGGAELVVAVARQLDAALEQRERLVERQVAVLELLDDLLELGDGGFEVLDGIGVMTSVSRVLDAAGQLAFGERDAHAVAGRARRAPTE